MKTLSDKAYDQKRLRDLEDQYNRGVLDAEMLPYLQYLSGEENIREETPWSERLRNILNKSNRSDESIALAAGYKVSRASINKVRRGEKYMSNERCKEIYKILKEKLK